MIKISHLIFYPLDEELVFERHFGWSIRLDDIQAHYQDQNGRDIVVVRGLEGMKYQRIYSSLDGTEHMVVDPDPANLERLQKFMANRSDSLMWEVLTELRYNPAFGSQMANIRDSFSNSGNKLAKFSE